MTPEQMQAEIDRLRCELTLTRLEVEAAWDDYDEKEHHERAA